MGGNSEIRVQRKGQNFNMGKIYKRRNITNKKGDHVRYLVTAIEISAW